MGIRLSSCPRRSASVDSGDSDWIIVNHTVSHNNLLTVYWDRAIKRVLSVLALRRLFARLGNWLKTHKQVTHQRSLVAKAWSSVGKYLQRQKSLTNHFRSRNAAKSK